MMSELQQKVLDILVTSENPEVQKLLLKGYRPAYIRIPSRIMLFFTFPDNHVYWGCALLSSDPNITIHNYPSFEWIYLKGSQSQLEALVDNIETVQLQILEITQELANKGVSTIRA